MGLLGNWMYGCVAGAIQLYQCPDGQLFNSMTRVRKHIFIIKHKLISIVLDNQKINSGFNWIILIFRVNFIYPLEL